MPSHFSSIGLPVNDPSEFQAITDRIGPLATPIEVSEGIYWRWASDCGAEVWLQVNSENELVGLTPSFLGQGRIKVGITARINRPNDTPLEGAFHGWANSNPQVEFGDYPFVFDVVDFARYSNLVLPAIVDVQIAAFAHDASIYSTVEEYDASQTSEIKYASQSFIPAGLFSNDEESVTPSIAVFTGHILATALKRNILTGANYYWALVETLGGSFDVVLDPKLCDHPPQVGGVLSGEFWLCGRILEKIENGDVISFVG